MNRPRPLHDAATIEAARAALADHFASYWPDAKPAKHWSGARLGKTFPDVDHVRATRIRHWLEVTIPGHLDPKHQRYGEARDEMQQALGAISIGGFLSDDEINAMLLDAVGQDQKAAA